jgi:hypothetical protein
MDITTVAAILAGIATSLTIITKWLWPWIKRGWDAMFGQEKILQQLCKMENRIANIEYEMTPNGGASLKDAVSRMELKFFQLSEYSRVKREQDYVPTIEFDMKGELTYANKAFLNLVGRTYFEVKNKGWVNSLDTEDIRKIPKALNNAIEDKRNLETEVILSTPENIKIHTFMKANIIGSEKTSLGYLVYFTTL